MKTIELHGDSTQFGSAYAGGGTYVRTQFPPSKMVQMMVDADYGAGNFLIKNLGVGGSTANDALTTSNLYCNGTKTFAQHIASSDADVIVCNWCINDAHSVGHTVAKHIAEYNSLKNIVQGAGKVFVAETANPLTTPHAGIVANYRAALVANGGHVIDTHDAITRWYPSYPMHLEDGVHPNAIMYTFIGQFVYNRLSQLGCFNP